MLKETPQDGYQDDLFRSRLDHKEVCAVWRENPYFQYFCGEEFFQHRLPVEPPSLSIFRKRIGEKGSERLLRETVRMGLKTGTVRERDLARVSVDTTVQEKLALAKAGAIRFPTDTQLCHKAREELVKAAEKHGVRLRQSYVRKSRAAVFLANKYMAARQVGRGRKMIVTVRNYLGRVMRDIERAIARDPSREIAFRDDLAKARKIYAQAHDPKTPDKIYSWHAPEVECIAKSLPLRRRGQSAQEIRVRLQGQPGRNQRRQLHRRGHGPSWAASGHPSGLTRGMATRLEPFWSRSKGSPEQDRAKPASISAIAAMA